MTIALFGGSFDPVHKGHVNAVSSLLMQERDIDKVMIMPAAVNPFKVGNSPAATAEDRLNMCRLAFERFPQCEISEHEISESGISYTVNTLEWLREEYPNSRLILTVGSDSLESLPRWFRAEDIFRMADIAAVSRSDEDSRKITNFAKAAEKAGARVIIVKAEPFEVSSTEIREKILKNQDISCYMDENVVKYILSRQLYCKKP
ncbi:MAG: nicotinate (nicotinamide) nucleotide adenylyltransferase [Huintestinicola sp.]